MIAATAIVYSFIAGLSTMVGVWLVRRYGEWVKRYSFYLLSLAVGVLLANAFLHLLPESMELTSSWPAWTLAGLLLLFVTEHIITFHACAEPAECEVHSLGVVSTLGIGLHSLIDGIIIGVGFEVSPTIGILSAVAVIAHELPEGIFTYTLLKHSKVPERKALIYSWIVALATPIGTLLTVLIVRSLPTEALGILLALAAGSFIYVGASDLTPELHKRSNLWNVLLALIGVGFVVVLGRILE